MLTVKDTRDGVTPLLTHSLTRSGGGGGGRVVRSVHRVNLSRDRWFGNLGSYREKIDDNGATVDWSFGCGKECCLYDLEPSFGLWTLLIGRPGWERSPPLPASNPLTYSHDVS
jgi:hypothetical protein